MGNKGRTVALKKFSYARFGTEINSLFRKVNYFNDDNPMWGCTFSEANTENGSNQVVDCRRKPNLPQHHAAYDIGCESVGTKLFTFGGYKNLDHGTKSLPL